MSSLKSYRSAPLGLCAAAMFLCAATSASAATDEFKARYHPYELDSYGTAGALYRRLDRQIRSYCESPGKRTLHQQSEQSKCHAEVLERVIKQIDNGKLTAIYKQRTDGIKVAGR